jgi:hypothetical protein
LVLRVHSGLVKENGTLGHGVFLFTSERYDKAKYLDEQRAGELAIAGTFGSTRTYFGITPKFIERRIKGDFDDATVIIMGCDGLTYDTNAAAFVERGADVVFGWRGLVTSGHTDAATQELLGSLLSDGLDARAAVARTMSEVGPDPYYESRLLYYPVAEAAQSETD